MNNNTKTVNSIKRKIGRKYRNIKTTRERRQVRHSLLYQM